MPSFVKYAAIPFLAFSLCLSQSSISTLQREGSKQVNGVRLSYVVMGTGNPILFIHGGPGLDHSYFLPHMEELAGTHTLVFFDQRASGRSGIPRDTNAMRIETFVDDIEGIRKSLDLQQVTVMGHSWGTLLALRYALKYPGNLKSLILVSPVPASSDEQAAAGQSFHRTSKDSSELADLMRTKAFRSRSPRAMDKYFRIVFRGTMYDPADVQKIQLRFPSDYAKRSGMLRYLGPEAMTFDLYPGLDSLKVPLLIIAGDHDPTPSDVPAHLHRAIEQSQLVIIKDCGHFPFIERRKEFFSAVRSFLGKQ